jgi:WD40 repeat protein
VLSAGYHDDIRIWDVTNRSVAQNLRACHSVVRDLDLDGKRQRCISAGYDGTVRIWDTANGTEVYRVTHPEWGMVLRAKSNYRRIVCGSTTGRISVIDFGAFLPSAT